MPRRGTVTFCHPRGNWYIVTDLDDPSVQAFTLYAVIDVPGYRSLDDQDEVEFECEAGPTQLLRRTGPPGSASSDTL